MPSYVLGTVLRYCTMISWIISLSNVRSKISFLFSRRRSSFLKVRLLAHGRCRVHTSEPVLIITRPPSKINPQVPTSGVAFSQTLPTCQPRGGSPKNSGDVRPCVLWGSNQKDIHFCLAWGGWSSKLHSESQPQKVPQRLRQLQHA